MSIFLHSQRIDVLHALALIAGGREPLPDGLERLAVDDPLLAPWARRLAPALRSGEPLSEVLRRARLLDRREAAALAAENDVAAGIAWIAESAAAPPRGLWLVRWFPTALVVVASAGFTAGLLAESEFVELQRELGLRMATIDEALAGLGTAILVVYLLQWVLFRTRGLRHLQHIWCPEVHRASAWCEFGEAAKLGDQPIQQGRLVSFLSRCRLTAARRQMPAWDLPWRTWMMLTRYRMPTAMRRRLQAEASGQSRLEQLWGYDRVVAGLALQQAISTAKPILTAALWLTGCVGFLAGFWGDMLSVVENLGSMGDSTVNPGFRIFSRCLWPLAGICAIQVLIAILRAFMPVVPNQVAQRVATVMSAAVGNGRAVAPAIAATAPHLRWPYAWRARAAAAMLEAEPGAGIVATLVRHRLLPSALAESGQAAEQLGAVALVRWADSVASRKGWGELFMLPLALYLGVGVMLVALWAFLQVYITPKFEAIARDLGIRFDGRLADLASLPWQELGIAAGLLVLILLGALGAWRWRRMRRILAAEVVLAGTASGASEGEIATALAGDVARQAGMAGDFPALAVAAGWPGATDPTELASRLAEAEERSRRWRAWIRVGLQVATPVVFAVPVWLVASGMFQILIQIIYAASDGGGS